MCSSDLVSSFKEEFDRKERLLKETLDKAAPMPHVTWQHAMRGLSVVKGDGRGELVWLVKRMYRPLTVDNNAIEPAYVKKLTSHIFIAVHTHDKKVTNVSTRKIVGLEYFPHYHQSNPDCWGNWKYPSDWETPDDILKIAGDAEAVLENINTMSIARRAPAGLPRLETLRKHVTSVRGPSQSVTMTDAMTREGAGRQLSEPDVWGNG